MLQDVVVHPQEQLQEDISSPLSSQIFEFCESEIFSETLQSSEVASTYDGFLEDHSSFTTNIPFNTSEHSRNIEKNGSIKTVTASTTKTPTLPTTNRNNDNLSLLFLSSEELDHNVSASLNFSPSPPFSAQNSINSQQEEFDLSLLQRQIGLADNALDAEISEYAPDPSVHPPPLIGPSLPSLCEDDCLSSMSSYMTKNLSLDCSFLDPKINSYQPNNLDAALSSESSGIFSRNFFLSNDMQPQELDYQGDFGAIFSTETLLPVYNTDLQKQNHLANGHIKSTLTTQISNLEDSTFKVGKLSVEERKEKIQRYMKKRNERNFSKKIKYACRKTLADSRPRIRGRFAKNDEFGETTGTTCSNHEEDMDDNVRTIQARKHGCGTSLPNCVPGASGVRECGGSAAGAYGVRHVACPRIYGCGCVGVRKGGCGSGTFSKYETSRLP